MSKAIKDKMDKLDTLSGGIVFGKEEAWERLQGKLEQKPVRKIALPYKLAAAAAAVLLIAVCISVLYNKTEDKIAAAPALYQYGSTTRTTQPTLATKESAAGIAANELKDVRGIQRNTHPRLKMPVAIETLPARDCIIDEPALTVNDQPVSAPLTVVAPITKSAMRVVHINELGNDEPQRPSYTSVKTTPKEIKVVTPQDDLDREQEAIVQRNDRPHGASPFFTLPGRNNASTHQSQTVASNPFNIKLSIQN